jgi:hypothetical protein
LSGGPANCSPPSTANLDTLPWPVKYGVPYGAANRLREALEIRRRSGGESGRSRIQCP